MQEAGKAILHLQVKGSNPELALNAVILP
jgi:hypothetical protein